MSLDKHTWRAEYFIEQGNSDNTYQVSYIEEGTSKQEHIKDCGYVLGYPFEIIAQYRSIERARKAALKHANEMSVVRGQGRVIESIGKLP